MKFGIEVEVYLLEKVNDHIFLNQSSDIIEYILDNTDERIYRDYYRYQIEIRSKPHNSLEDCFTEIIALYNQVKRILEDTDYFIAPLSYIPRKIVNDEPMYCGMHIHISDDKLDELIDRVYAIYPYLLIINRVCHSSPYKRISSIRMRDSPHVALVHPTKYKEKILSDDRYYDISINYHDENNRHRLKDCTTIEIRLFDTPAIIELNLSLLHRFSEKIDYAIKTINNDYAKDIIERILELNKINMLPQIRYFSTYSIEIDMLLHTLEYIYKDTPLAYDDLMFASCDLPIPAVYKPFYKTVLSKCIS